MCLLQVLEGGNRRPKNTCKEKKKTVGKLFKKMYDWEEWNLGTVLRFVIWPEKPLPVTSLLWVFSLTQNAEATHSAIDRNVVAPHSTHCTTPTGVFDQPEPQKKQKVCKKKQKSKTKQP